ncbi:DNA-binding protein [Paenibacillus jiagnxiensis]|uniref:DNA-binding protein n=1 Tax=Paenibacillus jiagnxiensis TaxID=3228926 RepID=UPI0033AB0A20
MDESNRSGIEDLDTLVNMLKMAFAFENWDKIIELSEDLLSLVSLNENGRLKSNRTRPLVYYYGYGHMMKGQALTKLQQYDQARVCIEKYAELGRYSNLDEHDHEEVEYFRCKATAHLFEINMLSGHMEVLEDYVRFLQENPIESLSGLTTIVKAAHKHGLNVDAILEQFSGQIREFGNTDEPAILAFYHSFLLELAKYQISRDEQGAAAESILTVLEAAENMENHSSFRKCAALFELIRDSASPAHKERYRGMMRAVVEKGL